MGIIDLIKGLFWIWPFISEMFFGGKEIKKVASENKFTTVLLMLLLISIFVNYLTISKIYRLIDTQKPEVKKEQKVIDSPHKDWVSDELKDIYKQ